MKWLTIDYIKRHSRIEYDCEDDLLRTYAEGAEETILHICNRTYENLKETYGEVPAAIMHASLLLCDVSYTHRCPVSSMTLSVVPYSVDVLIKPYILLAGVPLANECNRIMEVLDVQHANMDYFANQNDDAAKILYERIDDLKAKFTAVQHPTPMILDSMRKQTADLVKAVEMYIASLNT